ncbi:MAG: hypothetical protein GXO75_16435 [Calditrichaeota bacterium]|nr:hypothetical protein [Calditrichota bacterium]
MNETELTENVQSPQMGLLSRIVGVFTSPGKTAEAIGAKPNWLVPAIIIILLMLLFTYLAKPVIMQETMTRVQQMMESKGVAQDQIDTMLNRIQTSMGIRMFAGVTVTTALGIFIWAAIWLFISNIVLGAQASYAQMLGINVYRYFITTIGLLIKLPIMLSKQTMNVHFSLATFLPDDQKTTFLYKILMQVELFNIWTIVVLSIGIAVVSKLDTKKVWPWVVLVYVVWYVAQAALGSMFGG